ncbi:MAG: esterase FrsA [Actinomycetia bacterium]|nr:esterase FrsA [Actinomycetes bacterium]
MRLGAEPAADTDPRITSAVAHWAPRFTANGVTPADFATVTSGLESWDDWCTAWSALAAQYEELGRTELSDGRDRSAGEHLSRAAVYYHFAKFVFVEHPDQMRAAHLRSVACLTDALPALDPPGVRVKIPFEGTRLVGVLRHPSGAGPHPTVVLVPGLDSTKEELRSTEDTMLVRGMATFSVDGPGQGEAEYDLPIRADWSAPAEAILAALSDRPEVDSDRIAVWGVSLGGYYAPRVAAALGDRIRACVSLAGPFDFGACWDGLPELSRNTFQARSGAADVEEARLIAETITLDSHASSITAPLLVVFGRQDRLIPWQHANLLAGAAGGPVEVLMLEDGNHGCANVTPWHRPYTADWLVSRLSPVTAGAV